MEPRVPPPAPPAPPPPTAPGLPRVVPGSASATGPAPRVVRRRGLSGALANNVVLVIVAVVVLGVGGVALATGAPPRPSIDLTQAPAAPDAGSVPTTVTPTSLPAGSIAPRPAARSGHGETVVSTVRGPVTVTTDAGRVSGLSYGAITITHPDGTTATLEITGATRWRPGGRHPNVGDRATVTSVAGRALAVTSRRA